MSTTVSPTSGQEQERALEQQRTREPEPTREQEPTHGYVEATQRHERGQHASPPPIIRRVDNLDMQIAITFDACATKTHGYGFDRRVYQVLQREHVPATIFVSGRWVESHPDAMDELAADSLIEFANHSYDHPHMDRLSSVDIADEIDRTEAALGRHGLRSVAFRPPFGDFSDRVLQVARDKQLPAVLWDVVSADPSPATTAAAMIRTVVHKTRSGSIVIFHINGRGTKTAAALPSILGHLREQGFRFVHVSTLLASGGSARPVTPLADNASRLPAWKARPVSTAPPPS